ncbi:hypothetical protein TMEN_868 [Trichophyton mentagrophytes]|nr:hypothetical protein TMEN_868 [Trichophyton mentagrophytes]
MKKQLQKPSMPAHLSESALWPELFLAGPLIEKMHTRVHTTYSGLYITFFSPHQKKPDGESQV